MIAKCGPHIVAMWPYDELTTALLPMPDNTAVCRMLSNCSTAIVDGYRMTCLSEEKPALDEHADHCDRGGEEHRQRPRPAGGKQRDQRQQSRQAEAQSDRVATQRPGVLACHLVAHLLEQVVLGSMRGFEKPDRAKSAET